MLRIGFIGFGTVGQSTYTMFNPDEVEICICDPKCRDSVEISDMIDSTDLIYISVPTGEGYNVDRTQVTDILLDLEKGEYQGVVVVRSTCTALMLEKRNLALIYHPCFIQENATFDDQEFQQELNIVGGDIDLITEYIKMFEEVGNKDLELRFTKCTLRDACAVKLVRNLYGAYKVLFWNFVQKNYGNARNICAIMRQTPYQGDMENVGQDGELGFGGKCYPNNIALAFTEVKDSLIKFLVEYNDELQGKGR